MTPTPARLSSRILAVAALLCCVAPARSSVVTISKDTNNCFILLRDGKPFFINGTGGTQRLTELVAAGGNSIRTWGIESLDQPVDGKPLADRAQELGLGVTAGIWLGHEDDGFNYSDPAKLEAQRKAVREAVRKWKDHPAILIWGLGNEMEGPISDGTDPRIWKEVEVLAKIIKEEDTNHPVMTVIAGAKPSKVKGVLENCPDVDILGVNSYAGASGVGGAVKQVGWNKPFILTEYGPPGHWEVPATSWRAPIEPSSWDKARNYYATYSLLMEKAKDICLGSYVFLWGNKQECTSTWYGMFLKSGEKMPTVDAISRAWTGQWPEFRAPKITAFSTTPNIACQVVSPEQTVEASVTAQDFQNLPLTYEWEVTGERLMIGVGGEAEPVPPSYPECVVSTNGSTATLKLPSKPGEYRLFVTVRNGKGGASKDNIPFKVQ